MGTTRLSRAGQAYLIGIPAVGLGLLLFALSDIVAHPPPPAWIALPVLAALTGSFTFRIPGSVVRLTVAEPIVFTATLLYGPAAGTVTAAVDAVAMSLRMGRHLRTAHRFAFNVALLAIAIWPSSVAFFQLTGIDPRDPSYTSLNHFLGPLYLFAAGVYLSNSAILAIALGLERRVSPLLIWREQFAWVSASYFASASIAAILVVYGPTIELALIAVLAPLLVVAYLVFRTTVGRLDDANKHLAEVNTLYLSTIETLAMAIDAKDQVTHGHIRRVQKFAIGLAKALGVDDDRQLRAIEAAALLHDMGKLAIPEFILNKPGRLTASEFEVMKTHAAVGAEILSAIHFPYPVVPIVRHHHENWDGTGYPDGLCTVAIPIGARILSVVDCYDALTSDRPYRPAMSDAQATSILLQRRGTMYDPLVVDAFITECASLRQSVDLALQPPTPLSNRLETPSATPAASRGVPGRDELVAALHLLAELSPLGAAPSLRSTCHSAIRTLRAITDFGSVALYLVNESSLTLECMHSEGPSAQALGKASIPIAEQLSGWVAAHRTAVWNSDGALDLAASGDPRAAIASSLPLDCGNGVFGVLTLYGSSGSEITLSQRRALELVLPAMSLALFHSASHLSPRIDARDSSIRSSALALLDSLLSHGRQATSRDSIRVVGLVTLSVLAGDSPRRDIRPAAAELTALLTSKVSSRVLLQISDDQFLIYVEGEDDQRSLAVQLQRAMGIGALMSASLTVSWLDSSQALQASTRRPQSETGDDSLQSRVH